MEQGEEFLEIEKELIGLYDKTIPTFAQQGELRKVKADYRKKATDLIIKCMKKEIAILKDEKLKLSI